MTKFLTNILVSFLLLSFLLILGCIKDKINIDLPPPITEPTEPSNEPSEKLEVIWQSALGLVDTQKFYHEGIIITKDKVVATLEKRRVGDVVRLWDKQTGAFQFEWENLERKIYYRQFARIIDGNVFVIGGINSALIDASEGQAIWTEHHFGLGSNANFTLNEIFQAVVDEDHYDGLDFIHLTTIDKQSGGRDTILTITKTGNLSINPPEMYPPTGWITPTGDSLMIFKKANRTWPPFSIDIWAYNITADSLVWKWENFEAEGDSNKQPPLIKDGLIYLIGSNVLYCLNALDGSIVWQQEFSGMYRFTEHTQRFYEMIIIDDKLVFSTNDSKTYCFDAKTGRQFWKENDSVSSPRKMVHHKGIIYVTELGSGRLFAFDLETGEHFWREHPPNLHEYPDAGFQSDIAIDPETGYIYANDNYFVMCIKPYERE